jgi:hypothetical protein
MLEIPIFETLKEKIDFLVKNKSTLVAQKMNVIKHADVFVGVDELSGATNKAEANSDLSDKESFTVKAIINTTNVMDSHGDVHMKGIWKKSLKENKRIMHIQEHESTKFSSIIADGVDLKAYTQEFNWKELGYDQKGITEALVFESNVKKSRNAYMHDQYAKGYVNNHSVGMRYVKMALAVNDDSYEEENATWEKYIGEVVNREDAEKQGYFWAVQEAKAIEGSAVPLGSNSITPTLSMKREPSNDTHIVAEKSLQDKKNYFINL